MQSTALLHTAWGCSPSARPDPAPGLGKSARLPRHGSGQGLARGQAGTWSAHCPPGTWACCIIWHTLSVQKGQIQRQKQNEKVIYFRKADLNISFSPSPPPQHSPILRARVRGGVPCGGTCCKNHGHDTDVFSMNSICPTCTVPSHSQMCLCHTETRLNERGVALWTFISALFHTFWVKTWRFWSVLVQVGVGP